MLMEILNWFLKGDFIIFGDDLIQIYTVFLLLSTFFRRHIHHFKDDWFKYTYFHAEIYSFWNDWLNCAYFQLDIPLLDMISPDPPHCRVLEGRILVDNSSINPWVCSNIPILGKWCHDLQGGFWGWKVREGFGVLGIVYWTKKQTQIHDSICKKKHFMNEWTYQGKSESDGDVQELRVSEIQGPYRHADKNKTHLQESGMTPSWQNPFATLREAKTCRGEFYGILGYLLCYYIHCFAGFLNFVQECLSENRTPPGRNGSLVPAESCTTSDQFLLTVKTTENLAFSHLSCCKWQFSTESSKGRDMASPIHSFWMIRWLLEIWNSKVMVSVYSMLPGVSFCVGIPLGRGRDLPMPRWILVDFCYQVVEEKWMIFWMI